MTDSAEQIVDYKILYDHVLDSIEINYAEWAHLQLTKMVDVYKYEHLKLAPSHLIKGTDFVLKIIWTIANHKGYIDSARVQDEFLKATGFKLQDFYEMRQEDILTFLQQRPNMFAINAQKQIRALRFDEAAEFSLNGIGSKRV